MGVLFFLVCSLAVATASTRTLGDRLLRSFGVFKDLPVTSLEATAQQWSVSRRCTPNLGFRATHADSDRVSLYFSRGGQISAYGVDFFHTKRIADEPQRLGFFKSVGVDRSRLAVGFRSENPCTMEGRSSHVIGDRLRVHNWQQLSKSYEIPLTADAATQAGFRKGACIKKMGTHYGADLVARSGELSWDADTLMPVIPMYERDGSITAMLITCTENQNGLLTTNGWDLVPIPNRAMCLNFCDKECTWGKEQSWRFWSTMHVFFRDPKTISCPAGRCGDQNNPPAPFRERLSARLRHMFGLDD